MKLLMCPFVVALVFLAVVTRADDVLKCYECEGEEDCKELTDAKLKVCDIANPPPPTTTTEPTKNSTTTEKSTTIEKSTSSTPTTTRPTTNATTTSTTARTTTPTTTTVVFSPEITSEVIITAEEETSPDTTSTSTSSNPTEGARRAVKKVVSIQNDAADAPVARSLATLGAVPNHRNATHENYFSKFTGEDELPPQSGEINLSHKRFFRSIWSKQQLSNTTVYACYRIKTQNGPKLGCISYPAEKDACEAVRDRELPPENGNDECKTCQQDGCNANSSAIFNISATALLLTLLCKFLI